MKAMVLAAGSGTRLRPYTLTCPKPLLPVGGIPTIEWIFRWLGHYGIDNIGVNLSYLPEMVTDYFGDGSRFDWNLKYSFEESAMGTAGGVRRLADFFTETFVLVFGDVLTDLDLAELVSFHRSQQDVPRITMSLYRVPNPTECGIVELDSSGRITRMVEKPPAEEVFSNLANAGVLIVEPELLQHIPIDTFYDFGSDLFPKLLNGNVPFYGWQIPDENYLIDIGSPEKYRQVQLEWPTDKIRELLK